MMKTLFAIIAILSVVVISGCSSGGGDNPTVEVKTGTPPAGIRKGSVAPGGGAPAAGAADSGGGGTAKPSAE